MASTEPAPPASPKKVKVKTTWPTLPPIAERAPIRTERLLIRPFTASDVKAIHALRSQPKVMRWTRFGVVDKDEDQSRLYVERFIAPRDKESYNFVIVYLGNNKDKENDEDEGLVVGCGGCPVFGSALGWPEVGYMFRDEYWNKGLATEFLRAFVEAWWTLPRSEVEIEVDARSRSRSAEGKEEEEVIKVPEALTAVIDADNSGSKRVLEKAGFREYKKWNEMDNRVRIEGIDVALLGFILEAPAC
jgi:RimJ/RimL family protein N-acetyltransferase